MTEPAPEEAARHLIELYRAEWHPDRAIPDLQYGIAAAIKAARAAALEEAARVADQYAEVNLEAAHDTVLARYQTAEDIATAIRALGEESAEERERATS